MSTHLLPKNTDPVQRRLVVFVHGFGSSKSCWSKLLELLESDPDIAACYDLACFEYPTSWFNLRFARRIPRLLEIARGLAGFLESNDLRAYREVVLVGHSQGGLVIQSYLADKLGRGLVEDLYRMRLVMLIATPNLGSTLLSRTRKYLSFFFNNPQERALRIFDTEISELRATITERIVGSGGSATVAWPIPVQCFWGTQDGIVVEASARGPFDTEVALPIDGDHFSVIQPRDRQDPRYKALAEALLEPCGHRCVFEIDLYDIRIDVAPVLGNRDFQFQHGQRLVKVHTDNIAHVNRSLTFSRKNRCRDLFFLRYKTHNEGFLKVAMSHENEAPPQDTLVYDEQGNAVAFGFHPKKGETYELLLEVYKGFDGETGKGEEKAFATGRRDAHFHLVPFERKVYYKKVRLSVDLTAYLAAGWNVTIAPALYFFPRDQKHDAMCGKRRTSPPVPCLAGGRAGIWQWEIHNVREGVVDVAWDVAPA